MSSILICFMFVYLILSLWMKKKIKIHFRPNICITAYLHVHVSPTILISTMHIIFQFNFLYTFIVIIVFKHFPFINRVDKRQIMTRITILFICMSNNVNDIFFTFFCLIARFPIVQIILLNTDFDCFKINSFQLSVDIKEACYHPMK